MWNKILFDNIHLFLYGLKWDVKSLMKSFIHFNVAGARFYTSKLVLGNVYSCKFTLFIGGTIYFIIIPPPNEVGGGYTGLTLSVRLSVCPSVRPSVCRRHGFRSISQVCFGISISNFICMLMVAIGRSLLIFSDVTFKMAAWRPYWIFWFPDSNFTLALNMDFKLQQHNTYVYG